MEQFRDIITNSSIETPSFNLDEARKTVLEIHAMEVELESQRNNMVLRNKVVFFFIYFISFQSIATFGMILLCIFLMSHGRLSPYEYAWILNALQISVVAIAAEMVVYLGIVVRYLFKVKKTPN